MLEEAHGVLSAIDDRWGLATHDLFTAGYLAPTGDLAAAEASVRSAIAGFESIGEQFLVLESLGMLAGVAEARGDLEGAATTYAQLLEGARASGLANLVPVWLIRLGALRARQEDDATAAQLFAEAVARSDGADATGHGAHRSGRRDTTPRRSRAGEPDARSRPPPSTRPSTMTMAAWPCSPRGAGRRSPPETSTERPSSPIRHAACRRTTTARCECRHRSRQLRSPPSIPVPRATSSGSTPSSASAADSDAGRYAVATVGTVGSTLDEPDVAAMCRTLGLESVAR